MATNYMGTAPRENKHTRGLRFPAMKVGAFSMNIVLQASACCGANEENASATLPGGLVFSSGEIGTNSQRRLGILGTKLDSGTGLHRLSQFQGFSEELELRPQILGFVFKEGKVTIFRNGAKVGTYTAHKTAVQTFQWINGWLDTETESRGQLAEVKVYTQAFSDSIMLRLQRLLECKWGISGAQGDEWKTCENAEGEGGGLPPVLPGTLYTLINAGTAVSGTHTVTGSGGGSGSISITAPNTPDVAILGTAITRNINNEFDSDLVSERTANTGSASCIGRYKTTSGGGFGLVYYDGTGFNRADESFHLLESSNPVEVSNYAISGYLATYFYFPQPPSEPDACANCTTPATTNWIHNWIYGYWQDAAGNRDYVRVSFEGYQAISVQCGPTGGDCICDA